MSWIVRASPRLSIFDPLREPPEPKAGDRVRMTDLGKKRWEYQLGNGPDGNKVNTGRASGETFEQKDEERKQQDMRDYGTIKWAWVQWDGQQGDYNCYPYTALEIIK